MLLAVDAWCDAGLVERDIGQDAALIVGGHNLNGLYQVTNYKEFTEEPDFIDGLYAVHNYDTTHVGCISDVLQIRGAGYLVGAVCASGGYALRAAIDEIRYHDRALALAVSAVVDADPVLLHAMALVGAVTQNAFIDCPGKASRPFDVRRDGFVPAHGGAALVLEDWEAAQRRGARIYAELLGAEASMDGSHLPQPSEEGQARAMQRVLSTCDVAPTEIDYINGHFTSTPLGDLSEIAAIKRVFGDHAYRLKVNASKSILGHTMMASAIVETVGAVLQMRSGRLHPSINIEELDPAVDLDVCRGAAVEWPVEYCLKNAFGFGGLNTSILLKRFGAPQI
jgi:3-oxoacyl-(acyl-carrier-protein) synthase